MHALILFSFLANLATASPFRRQAGPCAGNTATTRSQWCGFSINDDPHEVIPNTGVTRTFWFEIRNTTMAPDGVSRMVLSVNGTVPGPPIVANWGDNVVIHVTNKMTFNGTSIHWHGIRQNFTNEYDGTSAITECPAVPNQTVTYRWRAAQYGTSWYHSHYNLQAFEGVYGPIIINGPATANYDTDLGHLTLGDWSHKTMESQYYEATEFPPTLPNGLINGKNTFTTASGQTVGSRHVIQFQPGQKHRLRLINTAIDTHFKFAIDNHTLTVIAADLVPIRPYNTTFLNIAMGQRYDVIVHANRNSGNYWARAVPQQPCSFNSNPQNIRAIVRYGTSTANPTSTGIALTNECVDEPINKLIPHVALNVGPDCNGQNDNLVADLEENPGPPLNKWLLGPEDMVVNKGKPTLQSVINGVTSYESDDQVRILDGKNQWVYYVIQTTFPGSHPIHLHGHDFYVLAQGANATYSSSVPLKLTNPPRRDTVNLAANGYTVIAFLTDNPGVWLMHCHIGWHASMGMAIQFIERRSEIPALLTLEEKIRLNATCQVWNSYAQALGISDKDHSGV